MSLVAAILNRHPPPVFHGKIRKIIAREMREKIKPEPVKTETGKQIRSYDLGKMLRANIESLIEEGGLWTSNDVLAEFSDRGISGSVTAIRRHLKNMVDLGQANQSVCEKTHSIGYFRIGEKPPPVLKKQRKIGSGNVMLEIMAKNRQLILDAVKSGCKTHDEICRNTELSRSCVQIQSAALLSK